MTNNGNRYYKEFRADIIRLVRDEHPPVNKVVQDFGVNAQTIRNWLKTTKIKKYPVNDRVAEL